MLDLAISVTKNKVETNVVKQLWQQLVCFLK